MEQAAKHVLENKATQKEWQKNKRLKIKCCGNLECEKRRDMAKSTHGTPAGRQRMGTPKTTWFSGRKSQDETE